MVLEFGIKRENEERRDGGCGVIFDPQTQLYAVGKRDNDGLFLLFSGGTDDGEDVKSAVLREITEESGLHDFAYVEKIAEALVHYHNKPKKINRIAHATCLLVILRTANIIPPRLEKHEKFVLDWYPAEKIIKHWKNRNEEMDYSHWIYFLEKSVLRVRELGYSQ